jgi:hypothetical protein
MSAAHASRQLLTSAALALALLPSLASAWVLDIDSGPRRLFLQVGVGTLNANNTTVNTVSLTVPVNSVGNGVAQRLNSNSSQASSPYDGYALCVTSQQQVYVGASYRTPNNNVENAQLRLQAPAQLTGGTNGDAIPIGELSWTSTALGNATADIPNMPGIGAGLQTLRTVARNTWVENCLTFFYANTAIRGAGTYTGTLEFSLVVP